MKITKRHLRRIVTENMAMKSQMSTGGGTALPKNDRQALIRELEVQLEKIKDSGNNSKNIAKEWLANFDKGEDFAKDKKFSLRTTLGQGGPTDEALAALQKKLNPSAFGKLKKMFGFKEGRIRTTKSKLRLQIRAVIKEAMDVVNVETGEVIDFGEESLSGLPDAAVPDLVKRLGLDMSPGGQLSNADFEKLEDETLGKQNLRHNKKALAQSKSNAERLNIDNLLNRLGDWAHEYFQDYAADNPGTDLQDVALDLAKSAEFEFEADEWDELIWHFDQDENALNVYTAESMG